MRRKDLRAHTNTCRQRVASACNCVVWSGSLAKFSALKLQLCINYCECSWKHDAVSMWWKFYYRSLITFEVALCNFTLHDGVVSIWGPTECSIVLLSSHPYSTGLSAIPSMRLSDTTQTSEPEYYLHEEEMTNEKTLFRYGVVKSILWWGPDAPFPSHRILTLLPLFLWWDLTLLSPVPSPWNGPKLCTYFIDVDYPLMILCQSKLQVGLVPWRFYGCSFVLHPSHYNQKN